MSKWKGLSAFHFSGNCGGSGGGHTYTSLSSLLHSFLEQGCSSSSSTTNANLGNSDEGAASPARASCEGVRPDAVAMEDKAIIKKSAERITILLDQGMADDSFLVRLASDVAKAAADMASLRSTRSELQRAVVFRLREEGYDAAICQTSWRATQDVSTGNYEYIDVVSMVHGKATTTSGERYIVDLGFTTEFAVARPTAAYALLLEALPSVLVARPNVMRQVVKVAGKEARRSLKDQGLTVPPWRKKRFMAAKWFSPHRQMAETVTGRHRAPVVASGDAMCRTVGFVLGPPVQPWLRYYAL